ncbi:FAD-binding domain-containing protein [Setomelanomma holmii]|uniref:FAD-binding domain-containing protein n=1 Tax=Setomelanomma holmii TaxID=210430 RepID=A0A9P4H6L7_9PLEO|nr:FAD-binding domain-containing protein [Setomelanomma holmii]
MPTCTESSRTDDRTRSSLAFDPPPRWSTYRAPEVVASVNVASEEDVAGGNGWKSFPKTNNLVLINLAQLNSIAVADDRNTAVIGGGAKVRETIPAADAAGILVQTGNCNYVGTLGALLGGGYGNLLGQTGFGVDNILQMRLVIADGQLRTISTSSESDLFWAMRGAGPNFRIVTSATVKAYPIPKEDRSAWSGALVFTEDSGPFSHAPMVIVMVWLFQGTPETGREAFKAYYDIGPVMETTGVLPFPEWNTGSNPFGTHSERKPAFGGGLDYLDSHAWREIWNKYVEFQRKPTAHASVILLEPYPMTEKRFEGEPLAAFPHRNVRYAGAILSWYTDASLDDEAVKFGKEVRELWRRSGRRDTNATYVNFAHGDEPLKEIYGDSLPRLRELKRK